MADRIVFVDRKPELLENDYKNGELFAIKIKIHGLCRKILTGNS